jgi:hypothetical protein
MPIGYRSGFVFIRALVLTLALGLGHALAIAAPGKGQTVADLDAARALQDAELRKAIAEADRAEVLARAPLAVPPLAGALDTRGFGAAGLVRAFDLAGQLAGEVCAALPADRPAVLYDPAASQGVVAARTVSGSIDRIADELKRQNKALQEVIDRNLPAGTAGRSFGLAPPPPPAIVPATVKAVADLAGLFRTDVTATGMGYGEGARALLATALAQSCPDKVAGLGAGYLGELDIGQYEKLMGRVRTLAAARGEYANRVALVGRLADEAKGELKKELSAVENAAGALLKTVDGFLDSLKSGEASEKSPLFNAARYLGYANRTAGALVLDFDLRLEGMSLVKDSLLTGQHLRLSGVAFLWYRLHEPDGRLLAARTLRRVAAPVEVDLRGTSADGSFWDGPRR